MTFSIAGSNPVFDDSMRSANPGGYPPNCRFMIEQSNDQALNDPYGRESTPDFRRPRPSRTTTICAFRPSTCLPPLF